MKINGGKIVLDSYNKKDYINNEYTLQDGTKINESVTARDLGIIMENNASFRSHINKLECVCKKVVSMIFRSFVTRDASVMMPLFKTLVLSRIDYCSVLWAPSSVGELRRVERIQANFTLRLDLARLPNGKRKNYWQRLKELNLYSVQRRFERYSIIYVWKAYHSLVFNPGIVYERSERRGLVCKRPNFSSRLKEESFFVRGPNLFNVLPVEVRDFPCKDPSNAKESTDSFKKHLDKYLKKIPDEPPLSSNYTKYVSGFDLNGKPTNSIVRLNLPPYSNDTL